MKKFLLVLLGILLLAGVGFSAFVWRGQKLEEEKAKRFYEARQAASFSAEAPEEIPVDFASLKEINQDIYAWLTIPGTGIDVPVLQREDDVAYYLSHNWEGEADKNGAICSESAYNGKDFKEVHTVLYGNNCEDGALFGSLEAFGEEGFFEEHPVMAVYTPDAIRYYRIFAAYEYDSRHLQQSFDLQKPEALERYVKGVLEQRNLYAQLDLETTVQEGDRLLTLSTGSSRQKGNTYLVQGILERTYQLW